MRVCLFSPLLLLSLLLLLAFTLTEAFRPPLRLIAARETAQRASREHTTHDLLEDSAARKTVSQLFVISAPLGVFLDNNHGLLGVLSYDQRSFPLTLTVAGVVILRTAAWVPVLFGFAGVAMGALQLLFDRVCRTARVATEPSWTKVLTGIAVFAFQYFLSGLLEYSGAMSLLNIHIVLAVFAVAGFVIFDGTTAG
jgi:hypothetical protein